MIRLPSDTWRQIGVSCIAATLSYTINWLNADFNVYVYGKVPSDTDVRNLAAMHAKINPDLSKEHWVEFGMGLKNGNKFNLYKKNNQEVLEIIKDEPKWVTIDNVVRFFIFDFIMAASRFDFREQWLFERFVDTLDYRLGPTLYARRYLGSPSFSDSVLFKEPVGQLAYRFNLMSFPAILRICEALSSKDVTVVAYATPGTMGFTVRDWIITFCRRISDVTYAIVGQNTLSVPYFCILGRTTLGADVTYEITMNVPVIEELLSPQDPEPLPTGYENPRSSSYVAWRDVKVQVSLTKGFYHTNSYESTFTGIKKFYADAKDAYVPDLVGICDYPFDLGYIYSVDGRIVDVAVKTQMAKSKAIRVNGLETENVLVKGSGGGVSFFWTSQPLSTSSFNLDEIIDLKHEDMKDEKLFGLDETLTEVSAKFPASISFYLSPFQGTDLDKRHLLSSEGSHYFSKRYVSDEEEYPFTPLFNYVKKNEVLLDHFSAISDVKVSELDSSLSIWTLVVMNQLAVNATFDNEKLTYANYMPNGVRPDPDVSLDRFFKQYLEEVYSAKGISVGYFLERSSVYAVPEFSFSLGLNLQGELRADDLLGVPIPRLIDTKMIFNAFLIEHAVRVSSRFDRLREWWAKFNFIS